MYHNKRRVCITFGEVACTHIGGVEQGKKALRGFSAEELKKARCKNGEYYDLSERLPLDLAKDNEAPLLIMRGVLQELATNSSVNVSELFHHEMTENVVWDKKYWDVRRSKTLNKQARLNTMFGNEEIQHSEDYRQPSVNSFSRLHILSTIREYLPMILGDKAIGLYAEGNYYHEEKSGIGFHGDTERKIVVGVSCGSPTILRFQWRSPGNSEAYSCPIDFHINPGDIYVMGERTSGENWKKRSQWRIVHSAGSSKYTTHK
jgi:hypothetical protein